jgi:hypothetical protein
MECRGVLAMSLLKVVGMTPEEREERRELDESCFYRVHAEIERGVERSRSFGRVAGALKIKRNDVIAGYWRHYRRTVKK